MVDSLLGTIFEVVDMVLDLSVEIDRAKRLSQQATGSDKIVDVPPDPKPLPPAAQRALAEADEREHARERAVQAANGADQAS